MANRLDFARAVLSAVGAPDTPSNEAALLTWMWAEETDGTNPGASFNPLNVQDGGFPLNSTGQSAYATWGAGVQATANVISQSNMAGILAALRQGSDGSAVLQAIQDSPWAGGHYGGALVGELAATLGNWASRANAPIEGAPPGGALGSGGVGVTSGGGGTVGGAQTVGVSLNPLDLFKQTTGAIVQPILQGAMRITLTGIAVAGGVALIVLGIARTVAPAVEKTTDELAPAAKTAAAVAAL